MYHHLMSTDHYARTILGFELTPNELVDRSPTYVECSNGHPQPDTHPPFCEKCGGKFRQQHTETPTPAFKAYAQSIGQAPEEILSEWTSEGLHSHSIDLHFHSIDPIQSPYQETQKQVLGFCLGQANQYHSSYSSCNLGDLSHKIEQLVVLAAHLGQDRPIRIYTCLYRC